METAPAALVRSLFGQLGWSSVTALPSSLPSEGEVLVSLNEALSLSADSFARETELQMALLRRPRVAGSERWVASATLSAGERYLFLEKATYEGVEMVAHVSRTVPLEGLVGESVADKMAYGVLMAADELGGGHPRLGWKSGAFKPPVAPSRGAPPAGRLACILGLCAFLAVTGIYRDL